MKTIYAIIESGGKQYRVTEGQRLDLDILGSAEGDTVELDRVLLLEQDGQVSVGKPFVENAKVLATVEGEIKGKKLIVFKYKPKVRYDRKTGHRQRYTRVRIESIQNGAPA